MDIELWWSGILMLKYQGWIGMVSRLQWMPQDGRPVYCNTNVTISMELYMLIRWSAKHSESLKIWIYLWLLDALSLASTASDSNNNNKTRKRPILQVGITGDSYVVYLVDKVLSLNVLIYYKWIAMSQSDCGVSSIHLIVILIQF